MSRSQTPRLEHALSHGIKGTGTRLACAVNSDSEVFAVCGNFLATLHVLQTCAAAVFPGCRGDEAIRASTFQVQLSLHDTSRSWSRPRSLSNPAASSNFETPSALDIGLCYPCAVFNSCLGICFLGCLSAFQPGDPISVGVDKSTCVVVAEQTITFGVPSVRREDSFSRKRHNAWHIR